MNQRVRVWFFYKKWWTLRLKFQTITNQNFEIKTSTNQMPTYHNKHNTTKIKERAHKSQKKKFHHGYGFGLNRREGERGESLRSWVQCRSEKIERVVATTASSGGNENMEKTTQWSFGHGSLDELGERERWLQTKISGGSAICLSRYSPPHATTITQSWISFSLYIATLICVWKCGILKFKV